METSAALPFLLPELSPSSPSCSCSTCSSKPPGPKPREPGQRPSPLPLRSRPPWLPPACSTRTRSRQSQSGAHPAFGAPDPAPPPAAAPVPLAHRHCQATLAGDRRTSAPCRSLPDPPLLDRVLSWTRVRLQQLPRPSGEPAVPRHPTLLPFPPRSPHSRSVPLLPVVVPALFLLSFSRGSNSHPQLLAGRLAVRSTVVGVAGLPDGGRAPGTQHSCGRTGRSSSTGGGSFPRCVRARRQPEYRSRHPGLSIPPPVPPPHPSAGALRSPLDRRVGVGASQHSRLRPLR